MATWVVSWSFYARQLSEKFAFPLAKYCTSVCLYLLCVVLLRVLRILVPRAFVSYGSVGENEYCADELDSARRVPLSHSRLQNSSAHDCHARKVRKRKHWSREWPLSVPTFSAPKPSFRVVSGKATTSRHFKNRVALGTRVLCQRTSLQILCRRSISISRCQIRWFPKDFSSSEGTLGLHIILMKVQWGRSLCAFTHLDVRRIFYVKFCGSQAISGNFGEAPWGVKVRWGGSFCFALSFIGHLVGALHCDSGDANPGKFQIKPRGRPVLSALGNKNSPERFNWNIPKYIHTS